MMPTEVSNKRNRVITLVLLAILLMSASLFLMNKKDADIIIVTFPNGKQLETEVADTPERLLFGLAFRDELLPDAGMLYIFESTGLHRVRTTGYKFPVDMIWVDEGRHIVHVSENVPPCPREPCPLYGPPPEPIRYMIQAAAGFVKQEGLQSGGELKFTLRM